MNDTRRMTLVSLLAALALLLTFALGALASYVVFQPGATPGTSAAQQDDTRSADDSNVAGNSGAPAELEEQMQVFYEAMRLVQEEYYGRPVDTQKMIYEATKGALESLGDYPTMFVEPITNQMFESDMRGNFEGIGAYVDMREGGLAIVAPMDGTPAQQAGLRPGDLITHVDGRDIRDMNETEAILLVRGPADSKVRLTVQRGDQPPFDVEVTRAQIEVPAVVTTMREDGIGVLEVSIFGDKTTAELDAGLRKILDSNPKGIILDLRNNGGGYVQSAQEMIGRFISPEIGEKYDDVALYYSYNQEGTDIKPVHILRGTSSTPHAYDVPMVVLVNYGTISASEVTAGALSDYGRAILIGEQTYGKGSVQNVHPLSDGSSVRITIAHWLSPNKRDINPLPTPTPDPNATATPLPTFTSTPVGGPAQADVTATATPVPVLRDRGLTPDIEIVRTDEDFQNDRDPQLDRAVEYLLTGK
jgi:carboxyl-terminal processing protease